MMGTRALTFSIQAFGQTIEERKGDGERGALRVRRWRREREHLRLDCFEPPFVVLFCLPDKVIRTGGIRIEYIYIHIYIYQEQGDGGGRGNTYV